MTTDGHRVRVRVGVAARVRVSLRVRVRARVRLTLTLTLIVAFDHCVFAFFWSPEHPSFIHGCQHARVE
jgi:hypothetical protein